MLHTHDGLAAVEYICCGCRKTYLFEELVHETAGIHVDRDIVTHVIVVALRLQNETRRHQRVRVEKKMVTSGRTEMSIRTPPWLHNNWKTITASEGSASEVCIHVATNFSRI